jgi:hypothetical protein
VLQEVDPSLVIVFADIALNEVKYARQCKTAGRTIRRLFCRLCPGLVPPGWNHSLACRMDFPCAVLWLFSCRQFMAIQAQPWIATGAHALGHIRAAGLGQGAFSPDHCLPLCVVDFYLVRRGSLSLVARAGLASVSWCDSPVVLVLPLFPDISRNSYLSTVVRIQENRGQTVVSTGPYHNKASGILGSASIAIITITEQEFPPVRDIFGLQQNISNSGYYFANANAREHDVVLRRSSGQTEFDFGWACRRSHL